MIDVNNLSRDEALSLKKQVDRLTAINEASDDLMTYIKLTMPDPDDPDDPNKSEYVSGPHLEKMCEELMRLERGEIKRLVISMPPRRGKSETATRRFASWFFGRNASRQSILAGYNEDFAIDEFGSKIKPILQSETYQEIFPEFALDPGKKSNQILRSVKGGQIFSVGVGGGLTGRGADFLIIDDPIKNAEEAESVTLRNSIWTWFTRAARTRLMPGGRILIIMTRWHEDDLLGRLTNPDNQHYRKEIADTYTILNMPEIAGDGVEGPDPLGRQPGEALHPERYPAEDALEFKLLDEAGYYALYQQNPRPPGGLFFRLEDIEKNEVRMRDYPHRDNLKFYSSSDWAVAFEQNNDDTVAGISGEDHNNCLWLMPDLYWEKRPADESIEAVLDLFDEYNPVVNWWEKGVIASSLTPLWNRICRERQRYHYMDGYYIGANKGAKARAIRGRMRAGQIKFPKDAPWWPEAKNQLLKFSGSGKDDQDDFVDFLAGFGIGLESIFNTPQEKKAETKVVPFSLRGIKQDTERKERLRRVANKDGF